MSLPNNEVKLEQMDTKNMQKNNLIIREAVIQSIVECDNYIKHTLSDVIDIHVGSSTDKVLKRLKRGHDYIFTSVRSCNKHNNLLDLKKTLSSWSSTALCATTMNGGVIIMTAIPSLKNRDSGLERRYTHEFRLILKREGYLYEETYVDFDLLTSVMSDEKPYVNIRPYVFSPFE